MSVFSKNDLDIIKENLDKLPKYLMPLMSKQYTQQQISACKWHLQNRDKNLCYMKNYRDEHNEDTKKKQKDWRDTHKVYEKARHKKWRKENHAYDIKRRKDYRKVLKKKYNIPDRYGGKQQAYVRGLAEEFFELKAQEEYSFDWLKSDKDYLMRVDIFFEELSLVIEYNGQQHYTPVKFGSSLREAKLKCKSQKKRDNLKYTKILEQGLNLLVIPYTFGKNDILKLFSKFNQDRK